MKSIFLRNFKLYNPFVRSLYKNQLFFHNTTTLDTDGNSESIDGFINSRRVTVSKVIKGKTNERLDFDTDNLLYTNISQNYLDRKSITQSKIINHNELSVKIISSFPKIKSELNKYFTYLFKV
jgi:hypothetical protein